MWHHFGLWLNRPSPPKIKFTTFLKLFFLSSSMYSLCRVILLCDAIFSLASATRPLQAEGWRGLIDSRYIVSLSIFVNWPWEQTLGIYVSQQQCHFYSSIIRILRQPTTSVVVFHHLFILLKMYYASASVHRESSMSTPRRGIQILEVYKHLAMNLKT